MRSAGIEAATPAIERPQTYTLDSTAIGIGKYLKSAVGCKTFTGKYFPKI
jgi:hypothetical protein